MLVVSQTAAPLSSPAECSKLGIGFAVSSEACLGLGVNPIALLSGCLLPSGPVQSRSQCLCLQAGHIGGGRLLLWMATSTTTRCRPVADQIQSESVIIAEQVGEIGNGKTGLQRREG